jgi:hypothetical protein
MAWIVPKGEAALGETDPVVDALVGGVDGEG